MRRFMNCFSSSIFRLKAEATRDPIPVASGPRASGPRTSVASGFSRKILPVAALALGLAMTASTPRADVGDSELAILPGAIVLRGQGSHQQILVEARAGDAYVGNRTASASFASSNPTVATVDDKGLVTAVRDGRALVTVRDGDRRAATMVEVEGAASPYPLTFRNHVMPVLTRVGCNSGPCHGALAGKSGLKLTLRGYDPEADYLTLTRQATARP